LYLRFGNGFREHNGERVAPEHKSMQCTMCFWRRLYVIYCPLRRALRCLAAPFLFRLTLGFS
jgi:hypothetical protein